MNRADHVSTFLSKFAQWHHTSCNFTLWIDFSFGLKAKVTFCLTLHLQTYLCELCVQPWKYTTEYLGTPSAVVSFDPSRINPHIIKNLLADGCPVLSGGNGGCIWIHGWQFGRKRTSQRGNMLTQRDINMYYPLCIVGNIVIVSTYTERVSTLPYSKVKHHWGYQELWAPTLPATHKWWRIMDYFTLGHK